MNVLTWDWSSKTIPAFSGPCTLLPAAFLRSVASCSATWHSRSKASSQSNRENEKAMDGRVGVAGSSSIWWGLLHHFHMDKTWHCVGPLLHAYTLHKKQQHLLARFVRLKLELPSMWKLVIVLLFLQLQECPNSGRMGTGSTTGTNWSFYQSN